MYVPQHFAMDDHGTRGFVASIETGDLVTWTGSGMVATFLPLLYDASRGPLGSLQGHVARNNDQWRTASDAEALVIAHGLDGYVSPSWYASKAEHGRVVPTWDYVTAQVYGELVIHDDTAWLEGLVRRLTERHESSRERPWTLEDAPPDFIAGQLRAIVGVELVVSRVEAKAKLSQNRPAADIDGVVTGLGEQGRDDLASLVAGHRPDREPGPPSA